MRPVPRAVWVRPMTAVQAGKGGRRGSRFQAMKAKRNRLPRAIRRALKSKGPA